MKPRRSRLGPSEVGQGVSLVFFGRRLRISSKA
jgi:hypothetical protein